MEPTEYEYTCEDNCKDTMRDAIEYKKIPNEYNKELTLSNRLSDEDKDLLIDNAYNLFNTYSDTSNLEGVMATLALLVSNYRKEAKYNELRRITSGIDDMPYKNKSDKQRIEAFKNHCDMLFGLIGTELERSKKGNELQRMLKDAYYNPMEYMFMKPEKITGSKSKIKDFLMGLKLPGKTTKIDDFMSSLN